MDAIAEQINRDMELLDTITSRTHTTRERIIAKLEDAVESLTIRPNDEKAMVTEAKMNVVNTLMKALNDAESSKVNLIKLKQRNKANEELEDSLKTISRTVVEYVKRIQIAPAVNQDTTIDDSKLDEVTDSLELEILAGELEISGSSAQDIELPAA